MTSTKLQTKKLGLALGSGGFRGFAHIGVIKSLEKHGISIDCLSGSSIGAWMAAYYGLFGEIEKLKESLTNNPKDNLLLLFDLTSSGGLIGGNKFYNFLKKTFDNKSFSDTKLPVRILATDLISGSPYVFCEGDLASAVRASTSIPVVFKPFSIGDKLLIDGGLSNPIPGKLLREIGADVVIGVNLYHKNEFIKDKFSMTKIAFRSTRIGLYNLARVDLLSCDIKIELDLSPYTKQSTLSQYFTKKIAEQIIKIGEDATDKLIPEIKKLLK